MEQIEEVHVEVDAVVVFDVTVVGVVVGVSVVDVAGAVADGGAGVEFVAQTWLSMESSANLRFEDLLDDQPY